MCRLLLFGTRPSHGSCFKPGKFASSPHLFKGLSRTLLRQFQHPIRPSYRLLSEILYRCSKPSSRSAWTVLVCCASLIRQVGRLRSTLRVSVLDMGTTFS